MRTTIAILLITSVVFFLAVESSPRGSSSGVPRDEPEEADLSHIEGLRIPPGTEIRHKGKILAKVHHRVVHPYLFQGNFAVLQETLSTEPPYHITFRHQKVTHKKWLEYISAYAYETNERWLCMSAMNTIQHYEQVDRQIAAAAELERERAAELERQRQAHLAEQQDHNHIHEAVLRHEAIHHGYAQDSHSRSSQGSIHGFHHRDSDAHLSQLNFGTESSSSAGGSAASSPTSSYRHVATHRIGRQEAIHHEYSQNSHSGSSQGSIHGSHHRDSDVHLSPVNFGTGSSAASSSTSSYRHVTTPRFDRHEAVHYGYSQDSHYGSSLSSIHESHHSDSDVHLSHIDFDTESFSSSSAGSSVASSPTSSYGHAITRRINPR